MYKKKNFSKSELATQLLIAGTEFTVTTSDGSLFPAVGSGNTFVGVIWGSAFAAPGSDPSREIIVAYRQTGAGNEDKFTITRAQENTSAKQWEIGDSFMLIASVAVFDEYETAIGTKVTANAGISGATKTKITYDAKGLVTSGADATQDDIGDGATYKQYSSTEKTKLAGIETSADVTDAGNVGSSIHGSSAKTTMVDADKLAIIDTEASNVLKTLTWAYVKSILKTYFDTLYLALSGGTLTGELLHGENSAIRFDDALSADGKYCGTLDAGIAGSAIAFGQLCYFQASDSRWELVDANLSAGYDKKLGICVLAANADGDATKMLVFGKIRADAQFPTMTIGSPVYMSETAGAIVVAQPTTADACIRVIGFANTADELFFNPSDDYMVHV